ncbi:MAG: hypothetical protein F4103_05435 [Boseongicola sp. SB0673_bin_14]|nr:hypothetical protein [Boseongicola sp. SB0673_bin_14]
MEKSFFSRLGEALKPNVIIIALIGAFFIANLSGTLQGEASQAISGLAMAFVGGLVAVMFFLVGPPPNPMVPESTALRILDLLTPGDGVSMSGKRVSKDWVIIWLILIGVAVLLYMARWTEVSDTVIYNLAAFIVGMIGSTVGKMADPEATAEQVPQSTVFRLLDILERQTPSTGRTS